MLKNFSYRNFLASSDYSEKGNILEKVSRQCLSWGQLFPSFFFGLSYNQRWIIYLLLLISQKHGIDEQESTSNCFLVSFLIRLVEFRFESKRKKENLSMDYYLAVSRWIENFSVQFIIKDRYFVNYLLIFICVTFPVFLSVFFPLNRITLCKCT